MAQATAASSAAPEEPADEARAGGLRVRRSFRGLDYADRIVRQRLAPVPHLLGHAHREVAGDRIVRVEGERLAGERVRAALIAALEGDAGKSGDCDGIPRIDRDDLTVEPLGVVDQADTHRALGL